MQTIVSEHERNPIHVESVTPTILHSERVTTTAVVYCKINPAPPPPRAYSQQPAPLQK